MGAVPGAQQPQAAQPSGTGFVLDIPPDASWEPFDTTDTLDTDGYYAMRITKESSRHDSGKAAGVFLNLEIVDEDARGKMLSKFLSDPRTTTKDIWFTWRGLIRSITGGLDVARAGLRYTTGMFTNQICYGRTGAYLDSSGAQRTGVDAFVTKTEYDQAVVAKKHRWPAKVKGGAGAGAVGALPAGLPSSFPGMSGMGLPGAPASPFAGAVPAPASAAPMQQAAPSVPSTLPPTMAPQQGFAFAPAAPNGGLPVPAASFQFPPVPQAAAPAQAFTFPPPPAAVAPQPGGAPAFPFPPAPGAGS
jgi:hypothetical protein